MQLFFPVSEWSLDSPPPDTQETTDQRPSPFESTPVHAALARALCLPLHLLSEHVKGDYERALLLEIAFCAYKVDWLLTHLARTQAELKVSKAKRLHLDHGTDGGT